MIDVADVEQLSIDCRIPVTVPKADVVAKLSPAAARYGIAYKEFDWLAPLYLPKDHFMIETLMRVYRQVSGDEVSQPIASGEDSDVHQPAQWIIVWHSARFSLMSL